MAAQAAATAGGAVPASAAVQTDASPSSGARSMTGKRVAVSSAGGGERRGEGAPGEEGVPCMVSCCVCGCASPFSQFGVGWVKRRRAVGARWKEKNDSRESRE